MKNNPVVHFEIYAHDAKKLAQFYASLFDWSIAQNLGATVMKPRAPVPGMGWFAMLVDPQGNSFAMWERDPNAK